MTNNLLELRNLVLTAELIVRCALAATKAGDCILRGTTRRWTRTLPDATPCLALQALNS